MMADRLLRLCLGLGLVACGSGDDGANVAHGDQVGRHKQWDDRGHRDDRRVHRVVVVGLQQVAIRAAKPAQVQGHAHLKVQ